MQIRWGWLAEQITVPYVPVLGPVHPSVLSQQVFRDVAEAGHAGRVLPYDKDGRWSLPKSERLLPDPLVHTATDTVLITVTEAGSRTMKAVHYGTGLDRAEVTAQVRTKAQALGATSIRIAWFPTPPPRDDRLRTVNILLKDFAQHRRTPHGDVVDLTTCPEPVRASLADLGDEPENAGFTFLASRLADAALDGPVLAVVDAGRVVGAIGPMQIVTDPVGRRMLLPQYFGVLAHYRGKGFGRGLWRAAMAWGRQHGADYQILQTVVGGASERLCMSEGLASLGYLSQDRL